MTDVQDPVQNTTAARPGLRVGLPERKAAREALEAHRDAGRLDPTEYARRLAACLEARDQAELLRPFEDLPAPHPDLPGRPAAPTKGDDEDWLWAAIAAALLLGLPVAVVLGLTYGAWWSLAVPVTATVVMVYVEHLLNRWRKRQSAESPADSV